MNRLEEFQVRFSDKSKLVFDYTVDWIEWSAKKNLAIAEDLAEFTVSQLRLPVEAGGLADYRHSLRDAYGEFGGVLKHHGEDYVARLKDVPAEVRDIFVPKQAVKKVAPKPVAAKPKVAKPKAAKPKAAKPKVAKPKAAKPKAAKPKAAKPKAAKPKAAARKVKATPAGAATTV
jgi:hypothetical protein